ncbi:replication factor C small subunit [Natronomonas sp.]|uniref:replication factor C small subunit n=1 Tax=Natronomonas sp. TaxID=2184060 RepID=UPI0032C24A6B
MSEAAATDRGREIWIEKYRPQSLEEVVGHDDITGRLRNYIDKRDLPHLLFAGPAGTGKCLTGETPVLTNRGVERIERVVGDTDGLAESRGDLEIATFDENDGFEFVSPSHLFGKEADDLVRVSTRDGGESTVTPEHRLLTVDRDGLSWTRAEELASGDRVVRPREAPLPESDGSIDWVESLDGERVFVHVTESFAERHDIPATEDYVGKKKAVFAGIRAGETDDEIAKRTDTPKKTVQAYRRQAVNADLDATSTVCSLSHLRSLDVPRDSLREHVSAIQYVAPNNNRSRPIEPPWELTPELAAFVGLALSEARIDSTRVKFYNDDEGLLEQFSGSVRESFGIEPKRGEQKGVGYRAIDNRTVTHFLRQCFAVFDDTDTVGSALVRAPAESRRAFVRAVFDAEGHVQEKGIVELTQKDGDVITLLSYLLAGEGIPTRRKTETKAATNGSGTKREYHVLFLSGADALSQFEERVGFTLPTKAERLSKNAGRAGNPNHDTIPVQSAVDHLCESLYLRKNKLLTDTLNPETPGRRNYLEDVERTLEAATEKIETAQEILETVSRLETDLEHCEALPAKWVGERDRMEPVSVRRDLEDEVGVRPDRLLEYSDGRRTPERQRATTLLNEINVLETEPDVEAVQAELQAAIERLNVPYNHVADGTDLLGTDITNLLENDDHAVSTAPRFRTVAERVREIAAGMLSQDVLEGLRTLDTLARSDLYFDEIESVERLSDSRRVYDLTVPETRNYVAGAVPTVMHNTTSAIAIAKEIYGDDWQENFLELNASDQRGIDVVRDRIKSFARASFGGYDHRIIFLDEADALTSDAQSALRRTMEQFSDNTRFVLSCNYSSQIIDPIQSRCAVFRFSPLGDDAVAEQIRAIADAEGIELTDDAMDALVYAADGDMRKAINGLQAAAVMGGVVDEEAVYTITSTARPEEIREMVTAALDGDFTAARTQLDSLLKDVGIAGGDIVDQMHRSVWEFDLSEREAVRLMERIGEADYRITAGANEQIQLEALLASLAVEPEDAGKRAV